MTSTSSLKQTTIASLILFIAAAAISLPGCTSTEKVETADRSQLGSSSVIIRPGDTVNLTVWGMSCPKCVTNVDRLLARVDGVTEVNTDMSSGLVSIRTGSTAPSLSALKAAVVEAGFTTMGVEVVEGS